MATRSTLKALGLAAIAVLVTAAAAIAYPVTSTTPLNVRGGPSTGYSVQYILYPGQVRNCVQHVGSWCRFGDGNFAHRNYLRPTGGPAPQPQPQPNPPYYGDRPDVDLGFCINAPNFRFGVNCNPRDFRPPRRDDDRRAQVCFYEHTNFRGDRFCARPGDADRSLVNNGWNDRISSIRVIGRARVQVCEHTNFNGRCAVITNNRPNLGARNNDVISSYRVGRR